MRLNINLTKNKQVVPFDYQHFLIGKFHRWIGNNDIHDEISLYSLSWLQGGRINLTGFNFPKGASWFISFWDEAIGKQLVKSVLNDPEVCCGMSVNEIQIQETPDFRGKEWFKAASPIFVRKYTEDRRAIHLTTSDEDADFFLTQTLKSKLKKAGLESDVAVSFDKSYHKPKTKLVKIKGIECRANFCPVIIEGNAEAVRFAWNVGVGHSTGSGFGALY